MNWQFHKTQHKNSIQTFIDNRNVTWKPKEPDKTRKSSTSCDSCRQKYIKETNMQYKSKTRGTQTKHHMENGNKPRSKLYLLKTTQNLQK